MEAVMEVQLSSSIPEKKRVSRQWLEVYDNYFVMIVDNIIFIICQILIIFSGNIF